MVADNERPNSMEAIKSPEVESPSKRIMKKRESDRACQRLSRQRKKSRVAYLEELVDQMKVSEASGQMGVFIQRILQLQAENDSLQGKLKAIENILLPPRTQTQAQAEAAPPAAQGTTNEDTRNLSPGNAIPAVEFPSHQQQTHATAACEDPERLKLQNESMFPQPSLSYLQSGISQVLENDVPHIWQESSSMPTAEPPPRPYLGVPSPTESIRTLPSSINRSCECGHAMALGRSNLNHWHHSNATLGAWMKRPSLVSELQNVDLYYEDTPVRAVIEGWDAVERRGIVHPLWRLMRVMDEALFTQVEGSTNRLGLLITVSRLLRAHIDPSGRLYNELPRFYLESHGQGRYAYATNFLAWPAMRRALVSREHQYCSNRFWRFFIKSMQMKWQLEFRDCYHYNAIESVYTVSPTFLSALGDLQNLGVKRDFLEHYPEFRNMIVAVDEIPPSISTTLPGCLFNRDVAEGLLTTAYNATPIPTLASGSDQSPLSINDGCHSMPQRERAEGREVEGEGADESGNDEEEDGTEVEAQPFQMPSWGAPGQLPREVLVPELAPLFAGRDFL
ncbi:hypothetical protein H2200_012413 [Cladophialophora chaetospira]|uniref:BZIP transcription factor n=1 Tax=Cladophialophora chaetospira TaxID=386627 RepID=A0AA38WXS6_9EURO|nr:hypothetical protein H2200_012413 [Cladophialophora chaetospira]